jgi:thiamine-phosphate pyrophosphorylase
MAGEYRNAVPGAAIVCFRGEEVLLVQRGREPNRGRWSFPGGKVEPGETARAAAERETTEETGLRVRALEVVDVYDALFPPYHYCVADYLGVCLDDREPVPGDDVMAARWVPLAEVSEYHLTPAMERVLARGQWLAGVRQGAPPALGMPEPLTATVDAGRAQRVRSALTGVYAITDAGIRRGRGHTVIARAALAGGARAVQLRDKTADAGLLLPIAREIRQLCEVAGALFFINDRIDLALASGADGVHLGQTDLPVAAARRMLGSGPLIGISVEDLEQVRAAERDGADYLGVGAIYGTANKADAGAPVGLEQVVRFRAASALPIVGIGGIDRERADAVRGAGADGIAVIGAIAAAEDPETATRALVAAFEAVGR